jgi:general secretion pathway protein J
VRRIKKRNNFTQFKDKKGFTLMELLIAVTILALIAVIIGGSLRLGIRAWERGEDEISASQGLRVTCDRMSQRIKSVYPYQIQKDGKKLTAFRGDSESVWFVISSLTRSEKNMKWVSYSFKDGDLTIGEGIMPDKKFLEKVSEKGEALDVGISLLKFEYFSTKTTEWKDSWDLQEQLPSAMRITTDKWQPFIISIPAGERNEKK